jgi:asparagine synthase (glutamine-hydrolysing)
MAGIFGLFHDEPTVVDTPVDEVLRRMAAALEHRGAAAAHEMRAGAAFGARGRRVGHSSDGSSIAALDGSVLNRGELQASGEDDRDPDLLASLYRVQGIGLPRLLRGDFALAAWDDSTMRGLLARDRQGIKPLYYYEHASGAVLFSSELKGLLASGLVSPELDFDAIEAYLSFGFTPGPQTAIRGIRKLHLGEMLVVERRSATVQPYWEYPPPRPATGRSEQEFEEAALAELNEAVRMRLEAGAPTGAMLSGGLDSALVVGLMARHTSQVKTFTVAFSESPETNELEAARRVAAEFGTDHREIELSFVGDGVSIEELAWRMDEPLAELSPLGLIALSSHARDEVSAALSGQGADGIFGGLPHHRTAAVAARLDWLPQPVKDLTARVFSRPGRLQRGTRALAARGATDRFLAQCDGLSDAERARLTLGPLAEVGGRAARRVVEHRLRDVRGHPTATYIFLDEQLAAVDSVLHYNDRASTGGPIDIRFPFLDNHVVEFAATIPVGLKVHGLERKYLLRRVARRVVPDEVLSRPKVGFFNAAIDAWVRAQADTALADYLLAPEPRYADFISRDEVARLLAAHTASPESGGGARLLGLLMLEVWLSHVVPRACAYANRPIRPAAATMRGG